MELTERLLNDAGGWQVMKQARALYEMGRVTEASWTPPLLQGRVREGEKEYRSGLKILSKTNIENICGCRDSRQRGAICAHSVAVGLEALKPAPRAVVNPPTPASVDAPASRNGAAKGGAATPAAVKPVFGGEGEPVALHIILPPNLMPSWQKNSVTVTFEAVCDGKRMPLGALDKGRQYSCSGADLAVVGLLRKFAGGELPGMAILTREQATELFAALTGHSGVSLGRTSRVLIEDSSVRPRLIVTQAPDGALMLRTELPGGASLLAGAAQPWLLTNQNTLSPVAAGLPPAYHEVLQRPIPIPSSQADAFLRHELTVLGRFFDVDASAAAVPDAEASSAAEQPAFILRIEGSLNHLVARLEVRYGEHSPFTLTPSGPRTSYRRNISAERDALQRLEKSGFAGPDVQGQLTLKGEQRILTFFARELPRWERDAAVEIGERFQHVTRNVERVEPRMEIRSTGENWFELQVELATNGGERFSAAEIQRLLQSGQSHVRRPNGKTAVFDPGMLDEFQQVLQDCNPQQRQPGLYRIDSRHAAYLATVAGEHGTALDAPANWRSWASAPRELERLQPVPLGPLDEVMRHYQKQGVYWMNFLARNGLSGILADEMGLGKTLQALAFLRLAGGKALVVCPSSLVYNWQREAQRFTSDRQVLVMQGPDRRSLFAENIRTADLVITSYPLLRRDIELYRAVEFNAAILDEAQHIKNPESQNAQSAFAIRARQRFALTGTPVENSVRDIWSLMNFLMPGYLGSRNDFRDRFERAISSEAGGPEHLRLVKRLRPFVLRRLKESVASELPEKIEQVAFCELSAPQKAVYDELLGATRRQLSELADSKDQKRARMLMLTAILRLRQACCDLRLLNLREELNEQPSGKLDMLEELLSEAIDGGHRVLIFSQFVGMLQILREWLQSAQTDYCYLDGSTKNRAEVVDRFQSGAAPVFLISLKAGGVGLNLTAADTVVHFDPWWNPAVEAQATDRAHRIGQKRAVTAYKLITRGTIEEKILALQTKKRAVIDTTIESEEPLMSGIDLADIQELLQ